MGLTTAADLPLYVLLPNAYRVIIPPMTSEMLNLVKSSPPSPPPIGLVDMAAQAGKLLDYSARAYESFTAITLAYVGINVIIMLAMHLLENGCVCRDRRPLMYEFDWSSVMPGMPFLLQGAGFITVAKISSYSDCYRRHPVGHDTGYDAPVIP